MKKMIYSGKLLEIEKYPVTNKGHKLPRCGKYKVSSDIANKVLQKPMSYLTREHGQEIIDLQNEIKDLETDQSDIYEFLTKKYKEIKKEINSVIKNKFAPTTFVKVK